MIALATILGLLLILWLTYIAVLVRGGIVRAQNHRIMAARVLIDEVVRLTYQYESAEPLATQAIRAHITEWQMAQLKEMIK